MGKIEFGDKYVRIKNTNRIGIIEKWGKRKSLVQLGSSGPFEKIWNSQLELITEDEWMESINTK